MPKLLSTLFVNSFVIQFQWATSWKAEIFSSTIYSQLGMISMATSPKTMKMASLLSVATTTTTPTTSTSPAHHVLDNAQGIPPSENCGVTALVNTNSMQICPSGGRDYTKPQRTPPDAGKAPRGRPISTVSCLQ